MKWWISALGLAALALGSGCSSSREAGGAMPVSSHRDYRLSPAVTYPSATLLFDRRPGPYSASEFAARSDWPSTEAYYPLGEIIFYREHFVDLQGPYFALPDRSYRRVDTYRAGSGFR
jgi:hypothetical protein